MSGPRAGTASTSRSRSKWLQTTLPSARVGHPPRPKHHDTPILFRVHLHALSAQDPAPGRPATGLYAAAPRLVACVHCVVTDHDRHQRATRRACACSRARWMCGWTAPTPLTICSGSRRETPLWLRSTIQTSPRKSYRGAAHLIRMPRDIFHTSCSTHQPVIRAENRKEQRADLAVQIDAKDLRVCRNA